MSPAPLSQLKAEGHELIDELVALGTKRSKVYEKLRKRLNVPQGKEHFGKMYSVYEVKLATQALEVMLMHKRQAVAAAGQPSKKQIRKAQKKADILPVDKRRAALAQMKADRERESHWTKLLRWLKIKRT